MQDVRGKTIAVYTFKGGAGKSTLVENVGAAMAQLQQKVLLVDFDPQCNLSGFFNSGSYDDFTAEQRDAVDRPYVHASGEQSVPPKVFHRDACIRDGVEIGAYLNHEVLTINDLFRPIFEENSKSAMIEFLQHQLENLSRGRSDGLFRSCNHDKLRNREGKPLLWRIPGSPSMAFHETAMGAACNSKERSSTTKVGACRYVLDRLCDHFDVVLVDLGPSSCALNMAMVMSCDYILPPCFHDMYSVESIHGLFVHVLPKWFAWLKGFAEFQSSSDGYKFASTPHFESTVEPFLLRLDPPYVLPIICTAYDVDIHGRVSYHHSNFYHTLNMFVMALQTTLLPDAQCPEWLIRSIERDPSRRDQAMAHIQEKMGPVVRKFVPAETTSGTHMVINSVARLHTAMQVSHEHGRTVVELNEREYYKAHPEFDPSMPAKKRKRTQSQQEMYRNARYHEAAMKEFKEEVSDAQNCYQSLATWLLHVVHDKTDTHIL